MAFSTDISLSGSFVNLNSVSGLATNLNFIAKITNLASSANDIKITLEFAELGSDIITG